ncbi:hypothetical protein AAG906_038910 [Vitis piasezkii]
MHIWSQHRQVLGIHGYTKGNRTRFIEKLRPFFLTLKEANAVGWMNECELAFEEIKCYLTQPPILSSPQPGEQLYMYLTIFDSMVDAKTRYSKMEQTTLALRSVGQVMADFIAETP